LHPARPPAPLKELGNFAWRLVLEHSTDARIVVSDFQR
jgi:hypothetical protein